MCVATADGSFWIERNTMRISDEHTDRIHSFINESVVRPNGGWTRLACRHILAIHFSSTIVVQGRKGREWKSAGKGREVKVRQNVRGSELLRYGMGDYTMPCM